MKAVRFHAHGDPDVLAFEDAPDPQPASGAALVRVRACALNHLDLWQRRGIDRVRIPLPHIPGSDVAGELVEDSEGRLAAGTRVLVHPGLSCGRCRSCLSGDDQLCPSYDVLGYRSDGGYAELVAVPSVNLMAMPDAVGFVQAAAFPLTFLTAWHMLVARGRLRAGETVLVLAGGSGVGQAAIQVAALHGARVLATGGSERKRQLAVELGAEAAFDHHAEGLVDAVRGATAGRGVDVLVEHVGQATWERSVRCLARGGRLVTCGATTGPHAALDIRLLFARQIALLGSYMGSKGELAQALPLFFAGRLRPAIDSVLPLAAAAEAHRRLERGDVCGKIVLEV